MIDVRIEVRNKDFKSLSVQGHGGGLKGKDIVCAAVSAVAQSALGGLLHYGREFIEWSMDSGSLSMQIKEGLSIEVRKAFNTILTAMSIGLREIAREYPHRVTVTIVDSTA